jgi:hypothetical protein
MHRRADPDARGWPQALDAGEPRGGIAVGEPPLHGVDRVAEAGAQVERVEQREPHAGVGRGGDHCLAMALRES